VLGSGHQSWWVFTGSVSFPQLGHRLRIRASRRSKVRLLANGLTFVWKRIGQRLPWAAAQCVSTHWLRHTTLTWVERNFGYGIARAYAGHTDSTGPATTTYIKADLQAVATALAALTGQPHPLATTLDELGIHT
jgi:integrase